MSPKILILLGLTLFFVFILFSYLIAKEVFTQIDYTTTVKLQNNLPRRVDIPFSLFSILGSVQLTLAFWTCLMIYFLLKKKFLLLFLLLTFPLAIYIEVLGKVNIEHPTPPHYFYRGVFNLDNPCHPIKPDSPYFCFYVQSDYSYPSGHMLRITYLATFLITALLFYLKKRSLPILGVLLLTIVLTFVSRIYLGEHWLSDVVGGLLLGSSLALITAAFLIKSS